LKGVLSFLVPRLGAQRSVSGGRLIDPGPDLARLVLLRDVESGGDCGATLGVGPKLAIRGQLRKRNFTYAKERCLLVEQSTKASHEEC
jgi:hypothetical protein